ncbi:LOW QUALITY PROTEIN: predicted protein, partial [Neisseria gonorrhoeae 35/02]
SRHSRIRHDRTPSCRSTPDAEKTTLVPLFKPARSNQKKQCRQTDCLPPRRLRRPPHLRRHALGLPAPYGAKTEPARPPRHTPQPQQLRHRQTDCGAFPYDAARTGRTIRRSPRKNPSRPPPADTERFFPQPRETAALRAKYGFADHETVFLFPSTGHTRKGLELLADFFEQTELPVKLAVAGSPLPRPIKNVVGLGFCTDMPELYRAADFTIMASLYEPFGLVGVESALCGTRVVLSENMACTEVMNEEAGFFFSRQNPETLAQAVARAVSLKKQGGHRLSDPMRALNYNPSLSHHIDRLTDMLASV